MDPLTESEVVDTDVALEPAAAAVPAAAAAVAVLAPKGSDTETLEVVLSKCGSLALNIDENLVSVRASSAAAAANHWPTIPRRSDPGGGCGGSGGGGGGGSVAQLA